MPRILAFGDSNTWGYKPNPDIKNNPDERYDENTRWTKVLQILLGEEYTVIEAGLNGRTTNITGNLPGDESKNGLEDFIRIFREHLPLDIIILQLGTNDLKERFKRTAYDIAIGLESIVIEAVRISNELKTIIPEIIILSPPLVNEIETKPPYRMFGALVKSKELANCFQEIASKHNCIFINLAEIIQSSTVDGLHLDPDAHLQIATILQKTISNIES